MRNYFMQTERIGFSRWTAADTELAHILWGNRDVTQYISASGGFSEEEITERLRREVDSQQRVHMQYWPIFLLSNDAFIGCCGLRPYAPEDGVYEIGFHLCPDYWGQGLGTEAAKAVIGYAFQTLKAKELFAGHHPDNAGSAGMLKKLGFRYTQDVFYEPTGLYHPSYRHNAE